MHLSYPLLKQTGSLLNTIHGNALPTPPTRFPGSYNGGLGRVSRHPAVDESGPRPSYLVAISGPPWYSCSGSVNRSEVIYSGVPKATGTTVPIECNEAPY